MVRNKHCGVVLGLIILNFGVIRFLSLEKKLIFFFDVVFLFRNKRFGVGVVTIITFMEKSGRYLLTKIRNIFRFRFYLVGIHIGVCMGSFMTLFMILIGL